MSGWLRPVVITPVTPLCHVGSATTVETPPPLESPLSLPAVTVCSTPALVYVKLTPPTDVKYGSPAGALTPFALLLVPHSLLPVSPDDAANVTPVAAPCCAIEFVDDSNAVSLDSQPPNDELTTLAFASVSTLL